MIQSQNQTIQIGISNSTTNGANLKYICEVCGELFNSIDFLKQHLGVHTTNAKVALNSKINSIISLAKNKKICSSAISIPQSMTIFNLKDISSKLSTQLTTQPTTVTSPPIINTNSNPINNKNDNSPKLDIDNNNNSLELKTVFQLEEPINFYELKNEKLVDLTPSFIGSNKQISFFPSADLACSSTNLAQFTSLPYHYSEHENIYVCNLCNCTYDSLRSIKAHLWKHSGHRELCYPINDHNRIAESTGKPIVTLKTDTSRKTIRSLQIPTAQADTDCVKTDQVRQSSGGICSVLLEVIEKLRETESIQKDNKSKRKCHMTNKQIKEPKERKKRKTSQKVNQLIQIQDEINMNNIKQQEVIKNILSNQDTECRIETSVVNSLYEDDEVLLNKLANQRHNGAKSVFVCHLCFKFVKDMNEHQCDKNNSNQTNLDQEFTIFMCHLCTKINEEIDEKLYTLDNKQCYFRYFNDLNLLKNHFESEHYNQEKQTIAEPMAEPIPVPNTQLITEPIAELIAESILESNEQNATASNQLSISIPNNINNTNSESIKLLELLANNDGNEQYACGLCLYVCYHLPSLKSHMWTHVKNEKFDYSINTSIINAALDYENKINRSLALIKNAIRFRKNFSSDESKEDSDSSNESDQLNLILDKKIVDAFEMINFKQMEIECSSIENETKTTKSIVAFKCSKCAFETVDLCILRIHKRNHLK